MSMTYWRRQSADVACAERGIPNMSSGTCEARTMKQTIAAAALAVAIWAPAVVAQVDNAPQRVEVVGDLDAEWASYPCDPS